jgi:hypothetical protein
MGQFGGSFGTSYPLPKNEGFVDIKAVNQQGKELPSTLVVKTNNVVEVVISEDTLIRWRYILLGSGMGVLLTILIQKVFGI